MVWLLENKSAISTPTKQAFNRLLKENCFITYLIIGFAMRGGNEQQIFLQGLF
ncbi:MAG: hypothetical protein RL115_2434 [Bacteroidota bacterium]|jgi:hypothetical protein